MSAGSSSGGTAAGSAREGQHLDHEYEIEEDGGKVAEISKRWFRVRDTYGVEIAPGQERHVIVPAVTAAIDSMTHDRG